jgi:sporulation protein YlmC with PRC-barrel domain
VSETTQFEMRANAYCTDGPCGQVRCVVIDPVAQEVTHLVIEERHKEGLGRLVPLELIEVTGEEVSLQCDLATYEKLEMAEEIQFMPGRVGYATYEPKDTLTLPYYGLGLKAATARDRAAQAVTHDRLPLGEVAVHRGDRVHATDGEIGVVQGLVIERKTHHVTHVLLQEGHLWGRKEVALPIRAVTGLGEGIQLNIAKSDVRVLPAVDVEHPNE